MSLVLRKFDIAIWFVVGDAENGKANSEIAVNARLVVVTDVGFGSELWAPPMGTTTQLLLKCASDGDNHAVTFKITTPLYVIGKKNDSERVRLGKTFVFSPPRRLRWGQPRSYF